jgi:2-C-methyl-D-erythritol 4-phosphate cytidylyltransferase
VKLAVIIPAAGFSRRYSQGADADELVRSKLDEDLGGRPVLQRTVELFTNYGGAADIGPIIVAGPADADAMAQFRARHADKLGLLGVRICSGGATHRWETVKAALGEVPAECTHIAVHDAARPCAHPDMIERVIAAAEKYPAVIPGVEVGDTLKRVSADAHVDRDVDPLDAILGEAGRSRTTVRTVEATLDRRHLVAVQTPQIFKAELLRRAYAQTDLTSTDDASLVEKLGQSVYVVDGDVRNIKITRPSDLGLARTILGLRPPEGRPVHKRF